MFILKIVQIYFCEVIKLGIREKTVEKFITQWLECQNSSNELNNNETNYKTSH